MVKIDNSKTKLRYLIVKGLPIVIALAFILINDLRIPASSVRALEVQPKANFNIDISLITKTEELSQPNSIIVAPIFMPGDIQIQDTEWYEGLYYYMASKLGQGDFLAHYILTAEGTVLQGNSKGEEQRFMISGTTDRPVIIYYLATNGQTDFSIRAKESLQDLLLDITNKNGIKPAQINLRTISLSLKVNEPVTMKADVFGGLYEVSLNQISKEIALKYKPILKQYALAITKVELPTSNVNYGDKVMAAVTVKNNSDTTLYQGTDYEPIVARTQNLASKFYINGTWLSQTQTTLMSEASFIKPGESKSFNVVLAAPLYFEPLKESFQLATQTGFVYPDTSFDLGFTVNRPAKKVIQVLNTETGQLNVRDGPWSSSKVIGRVSPGQRFFVNEITNSGYIRIDMGGGKEGWVVSKYTKIV